MPRLRGPLHPLPTLRHVAWAAALALGTVAGAFMLGLGLSYLAEPFNLDRGALIALGVMLGATLTGFGIGYVGFRRSCGWGRRVLGFVAPAHSLWHLLWWVPLTVVVGAVGASSLGHLLGLSADPSSATADGLTLPLPLVVTLVACVTVAVPLLEEIVFRRVLLDWLGRHLPMWLAAGIVILAFTVVHVSPAAMVYLIFTSSSLTLARLWFRTLTAPLVIHAVNNALVSLIVVLPG